MWERRRHQRHEIQRLGKIIFNHPLSVINCLVRDLADAGACLEVPHPTPVGQIPDAFELVIDQVPKRRLCGVAWRADRRIGVAFK